MVIKAGRFYSYWLKIRSFVGTSRRCLWVMLLTTIKGRLPIDEADKYIRNWATMLVTLVKTKVSVFNPSKVRLEKDKRYIIMCNHTSLYDIPLSYYSFKEASIRMLAKKELYRVPVFGRVMKRTGFPFIDRHNKAQAIKDLADARELMDEGIVLWIAPEGTRSRTGELKPFKKGGFITAIQAQAIIIPLVIKNANQILPLDTGNFNLYQEVELHIGEPVDAAKFSLEQKDELLNKVETIFKDSLCDSESLVNEAKEITQQQIPIC